MSVRSHRPGRRQPPVMRAGLAVIAVTALAIVVAFNGGLRIGGTPMSTVRAEVTDASNVRVNQPVRIKGVDVGKVTGVGGLPGGRKAIVTMSVERDKASLLRADARATIWWRTLLGRNLYVDLEPGHSHEALGDARIPVTRTAHQVELDQVENAMTPAARRGVRDTLRGLRGATADPGAIGGTLDAAEPALRALAGGLAPLRGTAPGDLTGAVKGSSRVVRALAADERALAGLIDAGQTTLAVTAARDSRLADTLRVAPGALATTRRGLRRLDATLDGADALTADLQPTARRVAPTLARVQAALGTARPLLRRAVPLVARLRPALRELRAAADDGGPLVEELMPVVRRVRDVTLPMLERADQGTHRPLYQLIGPLLSVLDNGGAVTDGRGHLISFQAGMNSRSGEGLLPCMAMLSNPTTAQKLTCTQLSTLMAQLLGKQPETMAPEDLTNPGRGG